MEIHNKNGKYIFTKQDGTQIDLNYIEVNFIEEFIRHNMWRANLEDTIDDDVDNYDFSEISRDEFVGLCIDEMQSKYEVCELGEPDYSKITFSVAEENEIWRD